eukprot:gene4575-14756_t
MNQLIEANVEPLAVLANVNDLPDLVEAQPDARYEARNEELSGIGVDLDHGKAASVKREAGHAEISIDEDMFSALGPILGEHSGELDAYNGKLDEHREPFILGMDDIATISLAGSEADLHDKLADLTVNFRDAEADLAEEAEILAPPNADNAATPCRSEVAIAVRRDSSSEYIKRLQANMASLPASYKAAISEATVADAPALSKAYIADIRATFVIEFVRCHAKVEADKADVPALSDAYCADIDATKEAEVARCHAKLEADTAAVLAGSKAGVASSNADLVSSCAGVPAWNVADLAAERDNVAAQSEIFEQVQANSAAICARSEAGLAALQDERDEQAQADLNEEVERYLHSNAYNAAVQARREADLAAHHGHIADQGARPTLLLTMTMLVTSMRGMSAVYCSIRHLTFGLAEEVQPYPHSHADDAAVHARSEGNLADHQDHAYHQDGRAEQSEFPQQGQAAKGSLPGWSTADLAQRTAAIGSLPGWSTADLAQPTAAIGSLPGWSTADLAQPAAAIGALPGWSTADLAQPTAAIGSLPGWSTADLAQPTAAIDSLPGWSTADLAQPTAAIGSLPVLSTADPAHPTPAKGSVFGWNPAELAAFNSNMESCYSAIPPLSKVNHASDCADMEEQREFLPQEQADTAATPAGSEANLAAWAETLVADDFHAQVEATNAAVPARRAADLAAERDIKAQQCKLLKHALAGTEARLATQQAKVQADNAAIPAWSEAHVASFHANMEAGRAADRAQRANVPNHREAGCSAFGDTAGRAAHRSEREAYVAAFHVKVLADNASVPAWSESDVASFHANMEAGRAAHCA